MDQFEKETLKQAFLCGITSRHIEDLLLLFKTKEALIKYCCMPIQETDLDLRRKNELTKVISEAVSERLEKLEREKQGNKILNSIFNESN